MLLGRRGSPLCDRLAACLEGRGVRAAVSTLDAPRAGRPVTVDGAGVRWDGLDLTAARTLFLESPLFPWPQPLRDPGTGLVDPAADAAEREARSLVVSAVLAAAESVRTVNPPRAAHLAASPALALDALAAAGVAVQPWRLAATPADAERADVLVFDAAGRDYWHAPSEPAPGDPALLVERPAVSALTYLVLGDAIPGMTCPEPVATVVRAAIHTLGLTCGAVTVAPLPDGPRVVAIEPGPDLAAFDARLEGRVVPLLADALCAPAAPSRTR